MGHQPGEETWSSVASETFVAEDLELELELDAFAWDAVGALRAVR